MSPEIRQVDYGERIADLEKRIKELEEKVQRLALRVDKPDAPASIT